MTKPSKTLKNNPMPIHDINKFLTLQKNIGRLFSLDVGRKAIGVAVSDIDWRVASPFTTLRRGKFVVDMHNLNALALEHNVGGLVIGWPLNMDGSMGARCDSVRDFTHALLRIEDYPVLFFDERLSSAGVERDMIAADLRRDKRKMHRDALAAAWILQSALDAMRALDYKDGHG